MDQDVLRAELERCHPHSYGWALSCCAFDHAEAEDVLQTAYLKVLQGRAQYDGRAAFKTWLFGVIRNTAAEARRRHWLRHLRLRTGQPENEVRVQPAEQATVLERAEDAQAFRLALARLPRRQQEVLHLVFYQDLSVAEAAEAMGVSVGSARTHYARAKGRLRELLNAGEHFDERR